MKILKILFVSFAFFAIVSVLACAWSTKATLDLGRAFCDGVAVGTPIDSIISRSTQENAWVTIVFNEQHRAVQSGDPREEVKIPDGSLWISFRGTFTFLTSNCTVPFQKKLVTGKTWHGAG